ncbi:MAG: DUF6206 family protein [Promethearchaeota archaeon]
MPIQYDLNVLNEFEKTIDTIYPEKSGIPIKILGYGEISLVFEILDEKHKGIAIKRLPIFKNEEQVKRHIKAYEEYKRILENDVKLKIPEQNACYVPMYNKKGRQIKNKYTLFCMQKKIEPRTTGNKLIHALDDQQVLLLSRLIMKELFKVWNFNLRQDKVEVGLDGQISNWAVLDIDPDNPVINEDTKLWYLDTSTPLFRIDGVEQMEPELFLTSAPGFIRWLLKLLFLKEVVDRYYDLRSVIIDFIANFYKEQKPEIIPLLIKEINDLLRKDVSNMNIESITEKEIADYYKSDKKIWIIFQNMRRLDRWLKTKIFRKKYQFYLPEKIKR